MAKTAEETDGVNEDDEPTQSSTRTVVRSNRSKCLFRFGVRWTPCLQGENTGLDTHPGVSSRVLQLGIEGSICVEPKLERDSGGKHRLDRTCKYTRHITDQCRVKTLCVDMSVQWLAVAILQTLLEGGVHVQQGSYQALLGTSQPASTEAVVSVAVSFV